MEYKITIERKTPNPNFERQYAEYEEANKRFHGYGPQPVPPNSCIAVKVLETVLTEEEFQGARNAMLKYL